MVPELEHREREPAPEELKPEEHRQSEPEPREAAAELGMQAAAEGGELHVLRGPSNLRRTRSQTAALPLLKRHRRMLGDSIAALRGDLRAA